MLVASDHATLEIIGQVSIQRSDSCAAQTMDYQNLRIVEAAT